MWPLALVSVITTFVVMLTSAHYANEERNIERQDEVAVAASFRFYGGAGKAVFRSGGSGFVQAHEIKTQLEHQHLAWPMFQDSCSMSGPGPCWRVFIDGAGSVYVSLYDRDHPARLRQALVELRKWAADRGSIGIKSGKYLSVDSPDAPDGPLPIEVEQQIPDNTLVARF